MKKVFAIVAMTVVGMVVYAGAIPQKIVDTTITQIPVDTPIEVPTLVIQSQQ